MSNIKMRDLQASDIFKMSKILKKMDIKLDGIGKNTSIEQAGIQFVQRILENLHLAEKEVNDFMADLTGMTAKEFSELPIGEVIEIFNQFKDQEDIGAFLKLAGK